MSTAQQRLDDVRAAIKAVLETGQSIRFEGRQVDRAQLASLRVLEAQYAEDASREAAASSTRPRQIRLYSGGKGI
ncbi:hypothetical protein [Pseudomonas citronellolis]|uniref:hypothetical protein n=1 Tax=Pseudomonas citronellolis TaxID=53408 RepID=UPI002D77562C|nr:hypothetical protein [Pseudomonas citronellolis]WRT82746.1 hypothetical protein VK748_30715 [Pseudomonas citronellolis]